jgi:hypothetical protein
MMRNPRRAYDADGKEIPPASEIATRRHDPFPAPG